MSDRPAPYADDDGFLARWSRRKSQVRDGRAVAPEPAPEPRAPVAAPPAAAVAVPRAPVAAPPAIAPAAPRAPGEATPTSLSPADPHAHAEAAAGEQADGTQRPALTMADVERLTKDSDYAAFASRDTDPQVRNAALKKLFHAEPHFNVMDGLDVYVDDYSKGEPLPRAVMRQMLQARALGLLDDELKEQDKPEADAPGADAPMAGVPAADSRRTDEDADLQLQPDDAAGPESDRAGAVDSGDGDEARDGTGRDGGGGAPDATRRDPAG